MKKIKNIVISGTNFWNPGDDFVRDGVISVLKDFFHDHTLNFLFYNFNQDFFPQSKFSGIHNMLSKGDLEQCKDYIDDIVIAGLSAGEEIKDLYNWILENGLERKVLLIGAGYENNYVDKHIYEEPELSIFKNARIITGRTAKTPGIIKELGLPYFHINCPAILSVDKVKKVPENKKIEKIALSVQLPHGAGVPNHSTGREMYELSLEIILDLYQKGYKLELIAHHKSEYFHFLYVFDKFKLNIPVIFSSFYQDLFNTYQDYDAVITTRLHSSLFANGFGIPGIVINDTDRHTHTMRGFPHSVWVRSKLEFDFQFSRLCRFDLKRIAEEADEFKKNLKEEYLRILNNTLTPSGRKIRPFKEKDSLAQHLKSALGDYKIKERVLNTLRKLTKDHWLENNIMNYEKAVKKQETWFDSLVFLNWYARNLKPEYYLEVGVRRGRSMTQVLSMSPETNAFGFDMWLENYGSLPEDGIFTINPGPDFVKEESRRCGIAKLPVLIIGDSHETLNAFFGNKNNQQLFDLILIDGDHSYEGAKLDLDIAFEHLNAGGAIVFDDISHVSHRDLKDLWDTYKQKHKDILFLEDLYGNGTGIAIKAPFNKYLKSLGKTEELKCRTEALPVHFFTIVLNGRPFIEYHINILSGLPFRWHWHIVEGLASLSHDTAWSLQNGAELSDELHANGLSTDGTSLYLDQLQKRYPENITVYRKTNGEFWDGKLEMVNAPLKNIREESLLWQIDADEFWTAEQIIRARAMFLKNPQKTAAYYKAEYFVGKDLVITSENTYGNHRDYEWIRTWRYLPGLKWISHEPPCLSFERSEGEWFDLAKVNPFLHGETIGEKLVFRHYAYVLPEQLLFKEKYYGYKNALVQWETLNKQTNFPVYLKDYFEWVTDDTVVERITGRTFSPDINGNEPAIQISGGQPCADEDTLRIIENKILDRDYSSAEEMLLNILKKDPYDLRALNNLSVVNALAGNTALASEIVELIVRKGNDNRIAAANEFLIQTDEEKGDFISEIIMQSAQKAQLYLELLLQHEPENISLLNDLGVVYALNNNSLLAEKTLQKALALDASHPLLTDNIQTLSLMNEGPAESTALNYADMNFPDARLKTGVNPDCAAPSAIANEDLLKDISFQLNFDLNDGCNLNCIMCGNVPNRNAASQSVMPFELFKKRFLPVMHYAKEFQYGCFYEPLLVPYFADSLWEIKESLPQGIRGNIITNGTLLTKEKSRAIVDSDIFKNIRFSVDSVTPGLFAKIRSGAKLEKVIKNIGELSSYRTASGSKSSIEFNFTIMKSNIHELPMLISMADDLGVNSVTTHKLQPDDADFVSDYYFNLYSEQIGLAEEEAKKRNIRFHGQKYSLKNEFIMVKDNRIKKECGYFKRKYILLTIFADGNISSSCKMAGDILGNLMAESFYDILQGEKMSKLLFSIRNSNAGICANCQMFQ